MHCAPSNAVHREQIRLPLVADLFSEKQAPTQEHAAAMAKWERLEPVQWGYGNSDLRHQPLNSVSRARKITHALCYFR